MVYSEKNMTIKRQYTICSSIEPKFYKALCDSLDAALEEGVEGVKFDEKFLDSSDQDFMCLTAKDYHTEKGVASQLFNSKDGDNFYIKGPMGAGLYLDPYGLNIVFVGGTGVLVVLDIVARLAIKLFNKADNSSGLG